MSSVDDILFESIVVDQISPKNHQHMLDAAAYAMDGLQDYTFQVAVDVPIEIYNQIADLVENDQSQINYLKTIVMHDPTHIHRPANALSIRDVFARLQRGEFKFWFCGPISGYGVKEYIFENYFKIEARKPLVKVDVNPSRCLWDWWAVSLLNNFAGYGQCYAFDTSDEARAYYYGVP